MATIEELRSIKLRIRRYRNELKNTRYLNTAIIEKECINNFVKGILEGPKYLIPLIDFIALYLLIFFLNVPE